MKMRNIFWGAFFIVSAAIIIASQVVDFGSVGVGSILITMFLAVLIISSVVRMEFFGIFVPFAFLYMIYAVPYALPVIDPWVLLLSSILLGLGFTLLFRKKKPKKATVQNGYYGQVNDTLNDNNPSINASRGSTSKYLRADALEGGQFSVSLGSLEVYFNQVRLNLQGAEVVVDCNMGSLKLYIPRHWNVVDKIGATLGGVQNNTQYAQPLATEPTLVLSGNVKLGNVEINYI